MGWLSSVGVSWLARLSRPLGLAAAGAALAAGLAVLVAPPAAAQQTAYEVTLSGVEDASLGELLKSSSTLFRLQSQPPPSIIGLERRADADRDRLQVALRSEGYYAGTVDIRVDGTTSPAKVAITVTPGAAFTFASVSVVPAAGTHLPAPPPDAAALGITPGARARAAEVVAGQNRLIARLADQGYAEAKVADRRVEVDTATHTMLITFTVDAGPLVHFGAVSVQGLERVDESLVRGQIPWQPGDVYDPRRIAELRTDLDALQVFQSVRIDLAEKLGPDGTAPVTIAVIERKRHFVGATIDYSTTDGFGLSGYWGDRNLFGGAEQLRLSLEASRLGANSVQDTDLTGRVTFIKPEFFAHHQTLTIDGAATTEMLPAYNRRALVLSGTIARLLAPGLKVSAGAAAEESRVSDATGTHVYTLTSLPLAISRDTTDTPLNPARGVRINFTLTPFFPLAGPADEFVRAQWNNSGYYDVLGTGRVILAGRLNLGSDAGAGLFEIPADKRFYAGGGGSIRGYPFQKIAPRNAAGERTGGRSLLETGAEVRIRVTETIGVVPFIDGGNAYTSELPDLSERLFWGAGLGLRYFTGLGPLRVDVATPINGRSLDSSVQVYISFGQAF